MIMRAIAIGFCIVLVSRAAAQEPCPDEIVALEDCIAVNGGTTRLAGCLTCLASILGGINYDEEGRSCGLFGEAFCAALDVECDAQCDNGLCGDEFSDYYHCTAENAYDVVRGTQGCIVDCDPIGNDGSEGEPVDTPTDGDTPAPSPTAPVSDDDLPIPGVCLTETNKLETCLTDNGRDGATTMACFECMLDSVPLAAGNCGDLTTQYCSSLINCDSSCAKDACLNDYSAAADCLSEAVDESCSTNCYPTSAASIMACSLLALSLVAAALVL